MKFTSKLQYKEYEVGEFADEQARSLEETVELIKNYPWDAERRLAEVQPTCPSVTIISSSGEYLKLGPYFNHKFCLYFLDRGEHLYEQHVLNLDDACTLVADFFENKLDFQKFEKHTFSLQAARYFVTRPFEYVYKLSNMALALFLGLMLCGIFGINILRLTFSSNYYSDVSVQRVISLLFFATGGIILWVIFRSYSSTKNLRLVISRGKNIFYFGEKGSEKLYLKSGIRSLHVLSGKNQVIKYIEFNDGTIIHIPAALISGATLIEKFPDKTKFVYDWR